MAGLLLIFEGSLLFEKTGERAWALEEETALSMAAAAEETETVSEEPDLVSEESDMTVMTETPNMETENLLVTDDLSSEYLSGSDDDSNTEYYPETDEIMQDDHLISSGEAVSRESEKNTENPDDTVFWIRGEDDPDSNENDPIPDETGLTDEGIIDPSVQDESDHTEGPVISGYPEYAEAMQHADADEGLFDDVDEDSGKEAGEPDTGTEKPDEEEEPLSGDEKKQLDLSLPERISVYPEIVNGHRIFYASEGCSLSFDGQENDIWISAVPEEGAAVTGIQAWKVNHEDDLLMFCGTECLDRIRFDEIRFEEDDSISVYLDHPETDVFLYASACVLPVSTPGTPKNAGTLKMADVTVDQSLFENYGAFVRYGDATTSLKRIRIKVNTGGKVQDKYCYVYCLQASLDNAGTGGTIRYLENSQAAKEKYSWLIKALYLASGDDIWGKTFTNSDGKFSLNLDSYLRSKGIGGNPLSVNGVQFKISGNQAAFMHFVLSYIYHEIGLTDVDFDWASSHADGGAEVRLTAAQQALVKEAASQIKKLDDPATGFDQAGLSSKSVTAVRNGKTARTPNITYTAYRENAITLKLGSDVTAYRSDGTSLGSGNVTIPGGTVFYLQSDKLAGKTTTYSCAPQIFSGGQAIVKTTSSTTWQDLGLAAITTGDELTLSVTWPEEISQYKIKIVKHDAETGSTSPVNAQYALEGARYGIFETSSASGTPLETVTIGKDGTGTSSKSYEDGKTLYVKETQAPDGYRTDSKVYTAKVSGGVVTVTSQDTPMRVAVQVVKDGKEAAKLPAYSVEGAVYTLYADQKCTKTLEELKIDKTGKAVSKNQYLAGTYYLKETKAPAGGRYHLDPEVHKVVITLNMVKNEKMAVITSEEEPVRADVEIEKELRDARGERSVEGSRAGIEFTFTYTADPSVTFKGNDGRDNILVTDENGFASTKVSLLSDDESASSGSVPALLCGEWRVEETLPPVGYDPVEPFTITVDGSKQTLHYVLADTQIASWVKIVKKDADTSRTLPVKDIAFRIKRDDGSWVSMKDEVSGEEQDEFRTNDEGCILLSEPLPFGSYTLCETGGVPDGYLAMEELPFKISVTGDNPENPLVLEAKNPPQMGRIRLEKSDGDTGQALAGISFSIIVEEDITDLGGGIRMGTDASGDLVELRAGVVAEQLETDDAGIALSGLLYPGVYRIHENVIPEYYTKCTDIIAQLTPDPDQETAQITCAVENRKTKLRIRKTALHEDAPSEDSENSEEGKPANTMPLGGVTFRIRETGTDDSDEQLFTTDENGCIEFSQLKHGTTYQVQETASPPGYVADSEVRSFTVDENGLADGSEEIELAFVNRPVRLTISKQDMVDGHEIPGASLILTAQDGTVAEEWISGEEPHYIEAIPPGTYTLTERIPADGYATAESITFTVEETAEIQKQVMKDERTKLQITKSDITDGKPVIGAELIIRDSEGKEAARWTTSEIPYYIEMLPVGTYSLTEITAPKGYKKAETIQFTIDDTGVLQKVDMKDAPEETETEKETKPEKETNPDKPEKQTEPPSEKKQKPTEKQTEPPKAGAGVTAAPKTGDDTPVNLLLAVMAVTGMFLILYAVSRSRMNK